MRKKISIIIPMYNQTEAELSGVLGSINYQVGVDFKLLDVHLINDGGSSIDPSKLTIFKNLDIHYYELAKNIGPGPARQYGIDHSNSDYFMFVDSDDVFDGIDALLVFFSTLADHGDHDLIAASFLETKLGAGLNSRRANAELPNIYGKLYRRAYVESLKLRFPKELRCFEDTYYSQVTFNFTQDIILLGECWVYCRRSRPGSLSKLSDFDREATTRAIYVRLLMEKYRELGKPRLDVELEQFLTTDYLLAKVHPPYDRPAFEREIAKTLKEFSDIWSGDWTGVQQLVGQHIAKYQDFGAVDSSDLGEFIARIEDFGRS